MIQCLVTDHILAHEFTELAEELSLTDGDGEVCHVEEEEEEHGHMEEHDKHEGQCNSSLFWRFSKSIDCYHFYDA